VEDVTGRGFKEVKGVDQVLNEALRFIRHEPNVVEVNLEDAVGRYLAEDVYSSVNVPPFNRSAVDGYAVKEHRHIRVIANQPSDTEG
jgi:Molybdopterin biosynthesis enzyme